MNPERMGFAESNEECNYETILNLLFSKSACLAMRRTKIYGGMTLADEKTLYNLILTTARSDVDV